MLPEGLALEPGEVQIRVEGSNVPHVTFATLQELKDWAAGYKKHQRIHMAMYFAHDSSGMPRSQTIEGAYVHDDGQYVAIRAHGGESGRTVEMLVNAVEARAKQIEQTQGAMPPRRTSDSD